ncbi:MAG: hypothetical protein Fur0023_13290 [Bacteroidia bacterium]
MKMRRLKTIQLALLLGLAISAQNNDYQLSKQEKRKPVNYMSGFLGVNSKYLYTSNGYYDGKFCSVSVYDKNTLQKINEEVLIGKKNASSKDMIIKKIIVYEDTIVVFWIASQKKEKSVFVETFTSTMQPIGQKSKIYTVKKDKSTDPEIFIKSDESGKKILIGAELSRGKNDNVKVEYKVLNSDLKVSSTGQIDLPYKLVYESESDLTSQYILGKDGFLYIFASAVNSSKDIDDESKINYLVTLVNTQNNSSNTISLKVTNKVLSNFYFLYNSDKLTLIASYSNISKDERNRDINGFMLVSIDNDLMAIEEMKEIPLTKNVIEQLNASVPNVRGYKKNKLSKFFDLVDVQQVSEKNIVLTLEIKQYYKSIQRQSGLESWQTVSGDVLYFNINMEGKGEIVWAKKIVRYALFNGIDKLKVNNIYKDNKLYSFIPYLGNYPRYRQVNNINVGKINKRTLLYAVIDAKTGKIEYRAKHIPKLEKSKGKVVPGLMMITDNKNIYFALQGDIRYIKKLMLIPAYAVGLSFFYGPAIPLYLAVGLPAISTGFYLFGPNRQFVEICKLTTLD